MSVYVNLEEGVHIGGTQYLRMNFVSITLNIARYLLCV